MPTVEAIVPEALWNQVNQILEEQTKLAKRPGKKPVHLFSGLAVCHCGGKMYVPSNTPKYVCGDCRNKIPVIDLDALYRHEIKGFMLSADKVAAFRDSAQSGLAGKNDALAGLRRELEGVKAEAD